MRSSPTDQNFQSHFFWPRIFPWQYEYHYTIIIPIGPSDVSIWKFIFCVEKLYFPNEFQLNSRKF